MLNMYLLPWRNAIHQTDLFLLSRSLHLENSPACLERCFMDFMSFESELFEVYFSADKQVIHDNER